jgi:TatD DNase family protein
MLIDTHAHIYHQQFEEEQKAMIERSLDASVTKILMPNIDIKSIEPMQRLTQNYPNVCYPMMGIHPCHITTNYENDLAIVSEQLAKNEFVAVGEIGIDLYWSKELFAEQKNAFREQLKLAKKYQLPAVIHCRDAFDETIEIVEEEQDGTLKGVFHCFVGTTEQAQRVIKSNFMLGIGGVLTFKNSGLAAAILPIDLQHLILETDAPYLAPVPYRGKRNEPAYTAIVAQYLADLKQISLQQVAAITTENAQRLFQLP